MSLQSHPRKKKTSKCPVTVTQVTLKTETYKMPAKITQKQAPLKGPLKVS